jgi:hypothetical protein
VDIVRVIAGWVPGFGPIFDLAMRFAKYYREQRPSVNLASDYILEQRQNFLDSYKVIFEKILESYEERHVVLMFDNVEAMTKRSGDFLVNLVQLLPNRFHIIIGIQIFDRNWNNIDTRRVVGDIIYYFQQIGASKKELSKFNLTQIKEILKNELVYSKEITEEDFENIQNKSE